MKKRSINRSKFNLLVHTDYLAKYYASTFVGHLPIDRIYYGVDSGTFHPLDRRECATRMGVSPPPRFVVGLFHSFFQEKRKGLLPFLKELSELAESRPGKFEALVVGHGSASARKWAMPNLNVRVLPFLQSEHELAYAFNACDVLVYPTMAENLSLTCLKSMACGTPIISSNVGGQREAIEDGVNGFLCEPDRSGQILQRVLQLADDEQLIRRLSLEARRTVVERFDIKTYVTNLMAYYKRLIQNERVAG
jgi:glycosyltransferase involved in cell wall biosynthesis